MGQGITKMSVEHAFAIVIHIFRGGEVRFIRKHLMNSWFMVTQITNTVKKPKI